MSLLGFSAGTSSPCLIAVLKCWTLPLESANRLWHDLFLLLKHKHTHAGWRRTWCRSAHLWTALCGFRLCCRPPPPLPPPVVLYFLLSCSLSVMQSDVTTCYRQTEAMMWMHNQPAWRHLLTLSCLWSAVSKTEDVWAAAAADIRRITFQWLRLRFTKWSDRNSVQL